MQVLRAGLVGPASQRVHGMYHAEGVQARRATPLLVTPRFPRSVRRMVRTARVARAQPRNLCFAMSEFSAMSLELNEAVQQGDARMVLVLTGMGADVNAVEEGGNTALHFAASLGNAKIVQTLVEAGADTNKGTDGFGYMPLHMAAADGHHQIAQVLLKANANVNASDIDGYTPLHMATAEGRTKVVKVLVGAGAEVNVTDQFGTTALHIAATNGFAECVQILAEAGANVDSVDNAGKTPIMDAVEAGQIEAVRVLLDSGVDVAVTKDGVNPLLALGEGYPELMRILVAAGADTKSTTWKDPKIQFGWENKH